MDLTGARGRRLLRFLQYWLHLSLLRCLLLLHRLHQLLLELTLRLGQHSLLLDLVLARLENRAGRSRHLIAGFESGICLLKFELKLANLLIERVLLLLHFSFDRKHGLLALLDLSGVLALQILSARSSTELLRIFLKAAAASIKAAAAASGDLPSW